MKTTKADRSRDLSAAIDELAALYEYGALEASSMPAAFLRKVAADVRQLRAAAQPQADPGVRTAEQERRATVRWLRDEAQSADPGFYPGPHTIAAAIERGDHITTSTAAPTGWEPRG